jgi:hypothetical protein
VRKELSKKQNGLEKIFGREYFLPCLDGFLPYVAASKLVSDEAVDRYLNPINDPGWETSKRYIKAEGREHISEAIERQDVLGLAIRVHEKVEIYHHVVTNGHNLEDVLNYGPHETPGYWTAHRFALKAEYEFIQRCAKSINCEVSLEALAFTYPREIIRHVTGEVVNLRTVDTLMAFGKPKKPIPEQIKEAMLFFGKCGFKYKCRAEELDQYVEKVWRELSEIGWIKRDK